MRQIQGENAPGRRLLVGALTNWLAFAATLAVGFFLTPYLVYKLGKHEYGIWAFVESLLAYFTLFDLGIAACVVRFVARFHATGDRQELSRLVSTSLALFIGLGVLAFAVGAAVLPFLLSALDSANVLWFTMLMLGNLALTLPLSIFPSILDGLERFGLKSAIRIVMLTARTIGTVVVLDRQPSLWNLGLLYTACNLVEHALLALAAQRCLPGLQWRWRFVDLATIKLVKGYSWHAFLAMVAGRTCVQSGIIIAGVVLGAAPVAYFAIAVRLIEFAKALLRAATNTLTPAVSAREAAGDFDAIRAMFLRGTRWVLYAILPVQIGLLVFGRPFLAVWLEDPQFATTCYPVLAVLAIPLTLVIAQSIAARILYGVGHLRSFARAAALEACANVGLALLLGPRFGLVGIAVAAALPSAAMCLWAISHTIRRLDVSPAGYLIRCWLPPLVAGAAPLTIWLQMSHSMTSWLSLASAVAAGIMPYAVFVVLVESRAALAARVRGLFAGRSRTCRATIES